jgi:anti-sigma-K factor RskA
VNIADIISSGLLEQYVLGTASLAERQQVEKWMNEYPEVKREIEEIEASLEDYATGFAMKPSPDVKKKIFGRIKKPLQEPHFNAPAHQAKVIKINVFNRALAAACLLLLFASFGINYVLYHKYRHTQQEVAILNDKYQQQQSVAQQMKQDMEVVSSKQSLPVVLNGTPHSPDALAKIFWMKNTGDVYVDPSNLPQTPSGKQYQLWAIVDGKPQDAGMISMEKGHYHIQKMKSFGKAQAFAITLEKEGGSPTPTMEEMVVIAKI